MHERTMKPGKYSYEFNGEVWVLTYIKANTWQQETFRHKASVWIFVRRNGLE